MLQTQQLGHRQHKPTKSRQELAIKHLQLTSNYRSFSRDINGTFLTLIPYLNKKET